MLQFPEIAVEDETHVIQNWYGTSTVHRAVGQALHPECEPLERLPKIHYHAIQSAFDALLGVVDEALLIDRAATERAKQIVLGNRQFSARDAVHLAVMSQHGIQRRLAKRNDRETGCGRVFGQSLVGREKGASSGPMLAPGKGRSQLQTVSGSQLIGIE